MIPTRIPTFEELGLPPIAEWLATLPRGLVLVTGPTGSGKSTTLASIIDRINEIRSQHILTIEDPVEYLHYHKMSAVTQREIGMDSPSFDRALRSALREDPDVLLLGEMRDTESIQMALTMAETGHLVSRRCIQTMPPRRSIGSLTCSPIGVRTRSGSSSPRRLGRSSPSASFPRSEEGEWRRSKCSSRTIR